MVNFQHLRLVFVWVGVIFLNSVWVSLWVPSSHFWCMPLASRKASFELHHYLSFTIINTNGGLCFLINFIEVILIGVVLNYLKLYLGGFGLGPSVLQTIAGEKPVFFFFFVGLLMIF
jgi:uncharacterized metal-binding protein